MNIIIPIGGIGERFKCDGYNVPKPLIKINGKEMIFYLLDNLKTRDDDDIYIIYHNNFDNYNFETIIKNKYANIIFIKLRKNTCGASETILYGLDKVINLNKKTITLDCDTFYFCDIIDTFGNQNDNAIFCFYDKQLEPLYSYIDINEYNHVTNIKEKIKISDYANTGCYCFESGSLLKRYCFNIINKHDNQKELYVSHVIENMIKDDLIFHANIIPNDMFVCVGTPMQLKFFSINNSIYTKLRICFDFNNTLFNTCYEPQHMYIEYLKFMKNIGHIIIINVVGVTKDIIHKSIELLENNNIPYDEIYFGKPYADIYIDSKSIGNFNNIEKDIGFYKTSVSERKFNQITQTTSNIITKSSVNNNIHGEIFYYMNIPSSIKYLFPTFINYGSNWYSIEKINGITLSYLFVNELLSEEIFNKFLNYIHLIHCSQKYDNSIDNNIYDNYSLKIKERYSKFTYDKFHDSHIVYNKLLDFFDNYELASLAIPGVIHGDPVFSNCILDIENNIKFIDMRGQVGNTHTIYGDIMYDYAKILQSISGYDEILLDKIISSKYRESIISIFNKFVVDKYGRDTMDKIIMIKNSLLFTLIPLHDNDKCYKYYNLIDCVTI